MHHKRLVFSGTTGTLLVLMSITTLEAQVELNGNVSITNDYTFRGISQTLQEPAVQGGLDLAGPAGFYAGVWGSSVNFGEDLESGARAQMELDVYGGIATSFAGFDLNLGGLLYAYPGAASARGYDFYEVYGRVARTFGPLVMGMDGAWSPDFFAGSGTGLFGGLDLSIGIPNTPLSIDGAIGHQLIQDNETWGTPDYTSWSINTSTQFIGLGLGLGFTGTNLDEASCFGGSDLCKTRFVVNVNRGL